MHQLSHELLLARLVMGLLEDLSHVTARCLMLLNHPVDVRIVDVIFDVEPPKELRRFLKATFDQTLDGPEVPLVVRENRGVAQASRQGDTGQLTLAQSLVAASAFRRVDGLLKILDRDTGLGEASLIEVSS